MSPLTKAAEIVAARYEPRGNVHAPELEDRYLSVSKLVKLRAREYAEKILSATEEDVPRYWAYKGNGLGDRALADFPCKEIRFEYDLGESGWRIQGHCDGIDVFEGGVVVAEHKSHGNPTEMKVELAFRQGALYLAMGWFDVQSTIAEMPELTTLAPGQPVPAVNFYVADYVEGGGLNKFSWPVVAKPAGVLVCIAPDRPPHIIRQKPMGPGECAEMLQFYTTKAWHILQSVTTGDMKFADDWDLGAVGLQEFALTLDEMEKSTDEELAMNCEKRETLRDAISQMQEDVDQLSAKIEGRMRQLDKKKLQVGSRIYTMVEMPSRKVEYISKPYVQLRCKEV